MHLARLHQKHSSRAAASSLTETAAGDVNLTAASQPPAAAAATARPNNAPVTGTYTLTHRFYVHYMTDWRGKGHLLILSIGFTVLIILNSDC